MGLATRPGCSAYPRAELLARAAGVIDWVDCRQHAAFPNEHSQCNPWCKTGWL